MNPLASVMKQIRLLYGCFLFSWILFVFVAYQFAGSEGQSSIPLTFVAVLALLAFSNIALAFFFRARYVTQSENLLQSNPQDTGAAMNWRTGHLLSFALAESVTLFGLVLKFMGQDWKFAAPFFAVGLLLLIFWFPRTDLRTQ